eukprot:scaffold3.g6421.t1
MRARGALPPPARATLPPRRRVALPAAASAAAAAVPATSSSSGPSSSSTSGSSTSGSSLSSSSGASGGPAASLRLGELWALLRPDRAKLLACAAVTVLSVVGHIAVPPCIGLTVDVISRGTAASASDLWRSIALLGAAYSLSASGMTAQVTLALELGEGLATRLRSRLFGALLCREALFFESARTGQLMQWLGSDIELLQSTVAKLLGARGLRSAIDTVGIVVSLFVLCPTLALVLLTVAPLLTPLVQSMSDRIQGESRGAAAAASDATSAADEIIENIKARGVRILGGRGHCVVKVFGQQQRELARFQGLVAAAHAAALRIIRLQALLEFGGRGRNALCVIATLGLGAQLALAGRLSTGVLYSFFVYSDHPESGGLGSLRAGADLAKATGAVTRTVATLRQAEGGVAGEPAAAPAAAAPALEQEQAASAGSVQREQQPAAPGSFERRQQPLAESSQRQPEAAAAGPSGRRNGLEIPAHLFRGEVEFRNVYFRHPGWPEWALEDVSFRIPGGQTVALVGPRRGVRARCQAPPCRGGHGRSPRALFGGGKSTIAALLLGLYEPTAGEVLVDGAPLSRLDPGWWRAQLGVVTQEPGLLTGHVRDIIAYGRPDASQAEVEAAATAAQAADFIAGLPEGYATYVGAGGVELSGGQAQRLAIARALLLRPKASRAAHASVLVLDEATSALDVATEARVAAALAAAAGAASATALVIAHRLSTVRRADRVVVVACGHVAEEGTHEELLALEHGIYARLVRKAARRLRGEWDPESTGASSSEDEDGGGDGAGLREEEEERQEGEPAGAGAGARPAAAS